MRYQTRSTRTALLAAGALSLAILLPGIAGAQPPGAQPPPSQAPGAQAPATPPGPAPATSADVNEMKLSQFVDAYEEVVEIQEKLISDMSDVQDQGKANSLHQQAREQMVQAVESSEISVDDFNRIVLGMQQDSKLNARVQSAMNSAGR